MKMPKALSMSKPRSSAKAAKMVNWQDRTNVRSGSSIIAALMTTLSTIETRRTSTKEKLDPNAPLIRLRDGRMVQRPSNPIESRAWSLINKVRKEQARVQKLRAFGTPPLGRETDADRDRARKILIKESHINNWLYVLLSIQEDLLKANQRADNRAIIREATESALVVRLEKGKFATAVNPVMATQRNAPLATRKGDFHVENKLVKRSREKYFAEKHQNQLDINKLIVQRAEEAKSETIKKKYPTEVQAEIDRVFGPSEEEFEDLLSGE